MRKLARSLRLRAKKMGDQALKLIKVEWEVLPHILYPWEGMKPDSPVVRAIQGGSRKCSADQLQPGGCGSRVQAGELSH